MVSANEQEKCVRGIVEKAPEPASREELVAMLVGAAAILDGIRSPRHAAYRIPLVARIKDALSREPEEQLPAVKAAAALPVIDLETLAIEEGRRVGRL